MSPAPHDQWQLARFLEAQRYTWAQAHAELAAGEKRSHWMWFIFPQLAGLGRSATAQRYALRGLDEAAAYLREPVLGERLRAATGAVLAVQGRSAEAIFGYPDHLKFHSCMTLFAEAAVRTERPGEPGEPIFVNALERYFRGVRDAATLSLLGTTRG